MRLFITVIFIFCPRLKVIGSMESHRSERSTRRMHELLAIRWKSRNQISRNQFPTYSKFLCRKRYENCIVRLMVLFHLVALPDFCFRDWIKRSRSRRDNFSPLYLVRVQVDTKNSSYI